MEKISEEIITLVDDLEKDFANEIDYEELKEATEFYNEMIRLGILKKRGYSLLSIDQININQPSFNHTIGATDDDF